MPLSPPPTLCIRYQTAFCTITDPVLHHTLHECQDAIGIRRRDFATPVKVTITDTTTGAIVAQTIYKREWRFGDAFCFLVLLCFSDALLFIAGG